MSSTANSTVRDAEVMTVGPGEVVVTFVTEPGEAVTTRVGDHEVTTEGPHHFARVSGLEPATEYPVEVEGAPPAEFLPDRVSTLPVPSGKRLGTFATVNDVHFGEVECGKVHDDDAVGPVLRALPGEPPYPETMNGGTIAELRARELDAVLVKGDLTNLGTADEYEAFLAAYGQLGARLHHVRGNHDAMLDPAMALEGAPYTLDVGGVTLAVLDTVLPGSERGQITRDQIGWLGEIASATSGAVIVFGHHHLWDLDTTERSRAYFGVNPEDSEAFGAAVAAHENIVGYFAGHTHRNRVRRSPRARHVPFVEISCTKDYPGVWAEYGVYEGGYVQIVRRISAPDALEWSERTRPMYHGLYRAYTLGKLDHRCFTETWCGAEDPVQALEGLRVVDMATVLAGPGAARYLADFGADVVKVESPAGDGTRRMGWIDPRDGESFMWKLLGRGKRSVVLDLKTDEGLDAMRRLLARADVLVENLRPGTLERLGLDPVDLLAANPGLVVLRVTGFGQDGPYAGKPGFATMAEAMSGFAAINGEPDGGPLLPPIALTDEVTALAGAFAVMVALRRRDRTGEGQVVDISLLETMLSLMGALTSAHAHLGYLQPRLGSGIPYTVPRGTYRTGDGRWVAISTSAESIAHRVMELLGVGDDPRFTTFEGRVEHREELDTIVADWVGTRDAAAVIAEFEARHAAIAPVYTMADLLADPHVVAREAVADVDGVRMPGIVARLSRTPGEIRHAGRALGADTRDVLAGLLDDGPDGGWPERGTPREVSE